MNRILSVALFVFAFSTLAYAQQEKPKVVLVPEGDTKQVIAYTIDVIGIIESKCLGCHSPSARNEKSRNAMQWEKLQAMTKVDAYAKLDAILEVLEEGSMPPSGIVEKYPTMKLSEAETKALKEWANALIAKLEK